MSLGSFAKLVFLGAFAYVLGSIPFGVIIGRAMRGIDIRQYGSGNIGATNAMRVLGMKAGIAVFVADALKGAIPTLLGAHYIGSGGAMFCGLCSVVGHNWPIYLGFRGGRGVATATGVFAVLSPLATLFGGIVWFLLVALTRYVSVGSMIFMASIPLGMWLFRRGAWAVIISIVIACIVIARHYPNMRRLYAGKESKIGERVSIRKKR